MDAIELRNTWLRSLAIDRGYEVSATDSCSLELETMSDGCCEMCYSERPVLNIRVGNNTFYLYDYEL
jgi:hypothetical protein